MSFQIHITQGYIAVVSDEDKDLAQYRWYYVHGHVACSTGNPRRKTIVLHRVILERILGRQLNKAERCYHVDGNSLNNQRHNLALGRTPTNMEKLYANNTSGYRGVQFDKRTGRWRAFINVRGKRISLGYYDSPGSAALAYNAAAKQYFGARAFLNDV